MVDLTQFNLTAINPTPSSQSRKNSYNSKVDPDRARDALNAIPPDISHDDWVRAGMAFHAAGGSFEDWDAWSAPAASYKAQTCRDTWKSFKDSSGGIGAGTLFHMARDNDWIEGKATPVTDPVKAAKRPPEPPRKPAPGHGCQ